MKRELRAGPEFLIDLPNGDDPPGGALDPDIVIDDDAPDHDWRVMLIRSARGKVLPIVANALCALRHAQEWDNVLAFNESALTVMASAAPPFHTPEAVPFVWSDHHDTLTAAWLQSKGIIAPREIAGQAIQTVARKNCFHPIRDYLSALKWDGNKRINRWLTTYMDAKPSNYTYNVGPKFLIGAVARVFKPGCQHDCCLILEGSQGTYKSTALRVLAGLWFCDSMPELSTKDAALQIAGSWIIELSELAAMNRSTIETVKAFMSRCTDRYRPPYGKRPIDIPRSNVFAGTVNLGTYLRDATGNRRFWPVQCGSIKIGELTKDRDQLWAEAVERFRAGDTWWLDKPAVVELAAEEQEQRYESGPWDETIQRFIHAKADVSIDEILESCIFKPKAQWTQADRNTIARALRSQGWIRRYSGPRSAREWRYYPPVFQCSSTCFSSEEETGSPEMKEEYDS
jgi:predicted P-loop ATPase